MVIRNPVHIILYFQHNLRCPGQKIWPGSSFLPQSNYLFLKFQWLLKTTSKLNFEWLLVMDICCNDFSEISLALNCNNKNWYQKFQWTGSLEVFMQDELVYVRTIWLKFKLTIWTYFTLRGSKSEIYFEDFKTCITFLFLHFAFRTRALNVVMMWCLILQVV